MSECSFSYPMPPGDPALGLKAARDAIVKQGGYMRGNTSSGDAGVPTPVGDIALSYRVAGSKLLVDVTDKPFLVSCAQIDQQLRAALAQVLKVAAKAPTATKPVVSTSTTAKPAPKVTVMPTQYIEGDVPKAGMSVGQWAALAIGAAVAVGGGTYWLGKRARRRR